MFRLLPFFKRMSKGVYKKTNLSNVCNYRVAMELLPLMLGGGAPGAPKPGFLVKEGVMPFFTDAEISIDAELMALLKSRVETESGETKQVRQEKLDLKAACLFTMGTGGGLKSEIRFRNIYTSTNACRSFIKTMLKRVGLNTIASNKRRVINGTKQTTLRVGSFEDTFLFALCTKQRTMITGLLGTIVDSNHLCREDSDTIKKILLEFKGVCNDCSVNSNLPMEDAAAGTLRRVAVSRTRLLEIAVQQEAARLRNDIDGMGSEYEEEADADEVQDADHTVEAANILMELSELQVKRRRFRQADAIPSDSEEDYDLEQEDDVEEEDDSGVRNPFILDQSEEQ